jgi:hypothetical protein
MAEPGDTIREYIRANRDRYTREAITAQLVANGHDPAEVEAAWAAMQPASRQPDASGPVSGRVLAVLILLGVVAVAITWSGTSYGANVIAPIVYAIATTVAVGVVYAITLAAQHGHTGAAAAWFGAIGIAAAGLLVLNTLWPIAIAVIVVFGGAALILARGGSAGRAVAVVSWLPLLVWLVSTGACVAPAVLSGGA